MNAQDPPATGDDGGRPDPFIDPRTLDPERAVVDTSDLADDEVDQIVRVLAALRRWRESEEASLDESRRTMQLGPTDMRAMRYLVVLKGRGELATPSGLATHLGISTASVTKLLDRLEAAGHIQRQRHPTDRRGVVIMLAPDSHLRVREVIGRRHGRRFELAKQLRPDERETVIRFLNGLSET
ncbi:MarR family winged helix-turn-helix transcriptional regulator [Rathayibacter sp. CAU 1779]